MLCTPPAIVVKVQPATGPAHAQHGYLTLANGTAIELNGDGPISPQGEFLQKLRPSDKIEVCFVERAAMNRGRLAIVENVETKDSFISLGILKGGKAPY